MAQFRIVVPLRATLLYSATAAHRYSTGRRSDSRYDTLCPLLTQRFPPPLRQNQESGKYQLRLRQCD